MITDQSGPIGKVRFSPGNRFLVITGGERATRLWSIDGPAVHAVLRSPNSTVTGVFFTPDGRRVAATSDEGTIRFWDTDPGAAARRVCEAGGTPITREEWAAQFRDHDYRAPC